MAVLRLVQSTDTQAQEPVRDAHVPGRLRELLGTKLDREVYLSTEEAAQLTGRPSREAFIDWARRHGIALRKASPAARVYLVRKGDLDFALRVK